METTDQGRDEMKTSLVHILRNGVLGIGIVVALASAMVGGTEARMPDGTPLSDPFDYNCHKLQGGWDTALDAAAYYAGLGDFETADEWMRFADLVEQQWQNSGCSAIYGSIFFRPTDTNRLTNAPVVTKTNAATTAVQTSTGKNLAEAPVVTQNNRGPTGSSKLQTVKSH
jgi:hypothetical protein